MKLSKELFLEKKAKLVVAASVALMGTQVFAAGTMTDTIVGKMTSYAANDLWGSVGVTLVSGLLVAGGAWEAKKTNDLKPLGYGIGMAVAAAGAFAIGPDLYTYIKTATGF